MPLSFETSAAISTQNMHSYKTAISFHFVGKDRDFTTIEKTKNAKALNSYSKKREGITISHIYIIKVHFCTICEFKNPTNRSNLKFLLFLVRDNV